MKCRKVKKYIEQYEVDDSGLGMKRDIREHIAACPDCLSALEYLESYKKKMGALKQQKAPAGFLAEINRRIDGPSFLWKTAQFLFYPLKIKVPLEAAGALASVMIILYSNNTIKQTEQAAPFPVAQLERRESSLKLRNMIYKDRLKAAESVAPDAAIKLKSDVEIGHPRIIAENKTAAPKIKKIILPVSRPGNSYEIALLVPPQTPDIFMEGEKDSFDRNSLTSSRSIDDEKASMGGAPSATYESRKEQADKADALKEEQAKTVNEPPADSIKKSAPPEKPRKEAIDKIKAATSKLGGKILSGKYNNQTKEMEYIILEIPAKRYPEFINILKSIGTLQTEAPEKAQKGSKMQQVKVLLLNQ